MKIKKPLLIFPLLLLFILAACAPQAAPIVVTEAPAAEEPAAIQASTPVEMASPPPAAATDSSAPEATTAPANPAVDVMALIQEKLQGHHDIDRILNANHTREEWNATLDRMIGYGAKINEEEKKIIIDFLLSRQ